MHKAFVLINTENGTSEKAAKSLIKIRPVSEVYSIAGNWDLIAVVGFKNIEQLPALINKKILKIDGVERTKTLLAFQAFSNENFEKVFSTVLFSDSLPRISEN